MRRRSAKQGSILLVEVILLSLVGVEPARASHGECVPQPPGIVSWWPGEGNSNDVFSGHHGTIEGDATFATGKVGQAFSLDGDGDYINIAHHADFNLPSAISLEAWVKVDDFENADPNPDESFAGILTKGDTQWRLQRDGSDDDALFGTSGPSNVDLGGNVPIDDNQWHHVVATYNGSHKRLYIDGVEDVSAATTGAINSTNFEVRIGHNSHGDYAANRYWHGLIDEPTVYNRALSAGEVNAIYEAGDEGKCGDKSGFVVNTTDDTSDPTPDGVCDSCSLREAIQEANANGGVRDFITFNIPGPGPHIIAPTGALPTISTPLEIDGYSEPDAEPATESSTAEVSVWVNGNYQPGLNGLSISSGTTEIRGLVLLRWDNAAIRLHLFGGNTIAGNYLGTAPNDAGDFWNTYGIKVESPSNQIGGSTPADRNIISNNLVHGIELSSPSSFSTVTGNYIGTDDEGDIPTDFPLGNDQAGVYVTGTSDNVIGGSGEGEGNLIADNGVGISIEGDATDRNPIVGNSIHSNSGLGIDLGPDGVTPNDADDADDGPNDFQNFPIITSVESGSTVIEATLPNTAPDTEYDFHFYASSTCDTSGNGEGEEYLGSTSRTTTESGNMPQFTFTGPSTSKQFITATATDPDGNTSEFSACAFLPAMIVNSTGDDADDDGNSDGVCDPDGTNSVGDPECTLREAIAEANQHSGHDSVLFDIPADVDSGCDGTSGVCRITPALNGFFGQISDPTTIDGYTQPGASPADGTDPAEIKIEVDGGDVANGWAGFQLSGNDTTIRGLAIGGYDGPGVLLVGGSGNVVEGNFIGVPADGESGGFGNTNHGIEVNGATGNTIGGADPGEGNVIGSNTQYGVFLTSGANGNTIQGNHIGVDALGDDGLPNSWDGLGILNSTDNTVGGGETGARNVISTNNGHGVYLAGGSSTTGNVVAGNYIGLDAAGTGDMGNGGEGIRVDGAGTGADPNVFGGDEASEGNVISANGDSGTESGIDVRDPGSAGNVIQNNYIGTDADGEGALGNQAYGVIVKDGATNTTIGGDGVGNRIWFNGDRGVAIQGTDVDGNTISQNSIWNNTDWGIDLGNPDTGLLDGTTANDDNDPDGGPNQNQNFPDITSVDQSDANMNAEGTVDSTPGGTFEVEVFSAPVCDASGFGEGKTFLGSTSVTDGSIDDADPDSGEVNFSVDIGDPSVNHVLTATATDGSGNTSEFSACFDVPGSRYTVNSTDDRVDANADDDVCDTGETVQVGEEEQAECTLRAAVMQTNADEGAGWIDLPPGDYVLTLDGSDDEAAVGDLDVTDDLEIAGLETEPEVETLAVDDVVVDGGNVYSPSEQECAQEGINDRVFQIHAGSEETANDVSMFNFTIRGGMAPETDHGGGIANAGHLVLDGMEIGDVDLAEGCFSNSAPSDGGGGIYNVDDAVPGSGELEVTGTAIAGNYAQRGGGVFNDGGIVEIRRGPDLSARGIESNTAVLAGGGLYNQDHASSESFGDVLLEDLEVTGNAASGGEGEPGLGGGIHNEYGSGGSNRVVVLGGSVSENDAHNGGGIFNSDELMLGFEDHPVTPTAGPALTGNTAAELDGEEGYGGGLFNGSYEEPQEGTATATLFRMNFGTDEGNTSNVAHEGGAIYNSASVGTDPGEDSNFVSMSEVDLRENVAVEGGGIYNASFMSLTDVGVMANRAETEGGGIYNGGDEAGALPAHLSLVRSPVSRNKAGDAGGGIYNDISLGSFENEVSATASALSDNKVVAGDGGGLYNEGGEAFLVLTDLSGNEVTGTGGALYNGNSQSVPADVHIDSGTLSFNIATNGGAVGNLGAGDIEILNSTISSNTADIDGGGIYAPSTFEASGSVSLKSVTVAHNSALEENGFSGDGIYQSGGQTILLENTIVAENPVQLDATIDENCFGTMSSNGFNLDDDGTCDLGQPSDQPAVSDAGLASLADTSPTGAFMHVLEAGSPARDGGPTPTQGCGSGDYADDQREVLRPLGSACDTGAYEATVVRTGGSGGGGSTPDCRDGDDNDRDGEIDYPADAGCTSPSDTSESSEGPHGSGNQPECGDGGDNDADDAVDLQDEGCEDATDDSEDSDAMPPPPTGTPSPTPSTSPSPTPSPPTDLPECNDGLDNDGDGLTDFLPEAVRDGDCTSVEDDIEGGVHPRCGLPAVICGTAGPDRLLGNADANEIYGGGGDDTCIGGGGDDIIFCGAGNDILRGGAGNDLVRSTTGRDLIVGGRGSDVLIGGAGGDVMRGRQGRDVLRGGRGNDRLAGGPGRDRCVPGPGRDRINSC